MDRLVVGAVRRGRRLEASGDAGKEGVARAVEAQAGLAKFAMVLASVLCGKSWSEPRSKSMTIGER